SASSTFSVSSSASASSSVVSSLTSSTSSVSSSGSSASTTSSVCSSCETASASVSVSSMSSHAPMTRITMSDNMVMNPFFTCLPPCKLYIGPIVPHHMNFYIYFLI